MVSQEEEVGKEESPRNLGLSNYKQAVRTIIMVLMRAGYLNVEKHRLSDGIHYAVTAQGMEKEPELFYIKWERELFHGAKAMVPGLKGTSTKGACTLNVDLAERAADYPSAHVLFANKEEDTIFAIPAPEFLTQSVEYTQHTSSEVVRCMAVEKLKRWDLWEKYRSQMQPMLSKLQYEEEVLFPTAADLMKKQEDRKKTIAMIEGKNKKQEEKPMLSATKELAEQVKKYTSSKRGNNEVVFEKLMEDMKRFRMSDSKYAVMMVAKLAYELGLKDGGTKDNK
jgi:hypothetical protein